MVSPDALPTKRGVFVSAVLYVRSETTTVGEFVRKLDRYLDKHFAMHEMIVVDDASRDGTSEAVRAAMVDLRGALVLLELAKAEGPEAAILAGLERAIGDFVFEIESTRRLTDLEVLEGIWRVAAEGVDIVSAGSGTPGLLKRVFYRLVNRFSQLDIEARGVTIRVVSRRALNAMLNLNERTPFRKALYAATGYSRTYVTLTPAKSPSPTADPSRERLSLAMDVVVSFSDLGLRAVNVLSFVFLLTSLAAGSYTVYIFVFTNGVVSGWTTTMLTLSVGFTGLFVILGLLGEYLSRILIEVRNRPLFTVRESWVHIPTDAPSHHRRSQSTGDAETLSD